MLDGLSTLFTHKNWEIRKDEKGRRCHIMGTHVDCTGFDDSDKTLIGESLSWTLSDTSTLCYWCGIDVPDEIQSLMILMADKMGKVDA